MPGKDWKAKLPLVLRILHWVIIVNFVVNIFYGGYQVFVVLAPGDAVGPLFGNATTMSGDLLIARRLYAIEVWISITGLAIYLAITEYLPRLRGAEK